MFHTTRLKLTAWYLVIIMLVSFVFSFIVFINFNSELQRFEQFQTIHREELENRLITNARNRLIYNLVVINICVLAGSTLAGFFLAGRTLAPIKKALEDQALFVGNASHELKTPLTALRAEIEVFLRSRTQTIKEARVILKSNLEEALRLQILSENLIQLTTLSGLQREPNFQRLQLQTLIQKSVKGVLPLADEKKVNVVNKTTRITLIGDENNLLQLFTILLDNAIKYSHKGKKVTIVSKVREGMVAISFSDQGIGIPKAELENIFDRFYRVDKSRTSHDVPGYGLGLAIAKEVVSMHSGSIYAASSSRGSVFTVELPV